MQTSLLQTTLSLLIGAVITINGVTANVDDITKEATAAVNGANLHQIATVLEIYYMEKGEYPTVQNGEALIDVFQNEGYILNRPIDGNVFSYESKDGGQNYKLSLNQQ